MGQIIDLERKDLIYRCNYVKNSIVWINLIGPPVSLIFLIFSILRMILVKKKKTFLTNIIIFIFSSEILQCISKLLQILKYGFKDQRDDKGFTDGDTPRGIICQIQIILAIFSDLCSLLGTLLMSFRCYDVIKNKKRIFDNSLNGIISILLVLILSLTFSIAFLYIDRSVTEGNLSYRYDLRDRCSYWCWLEHKPSLGCLALYWIIVIINIYFARKTNGYLKRGYTKIIEDSEIALEKIGEIKGPVNEEIIEANNYEKKNSEKKGKEEKFIILTNEEKKRIENLKLMRLKCSIYPWVTIVYWLFAATYRIIDDLAMMQYDSGDDPYGGEELEKKDFENHPFFQFIVQFFLAVYTFFSSIRGILYGLSFIVFEEKIFFDFFKKCFKKCYKAEDEEDEEEFRDSSRNSNSFLLSETKS